MAQFDHEKTKVDSPNEQIGFKTLKYSVAESAKVVKIAIQKHTAEAMEFTVKTTDGSAIKEKDYIEFTESVTMKASETEKVIEIQIIEDANWEPDKEFYVTLNSPANGEQLPGDDTKCTVVILDDDRPGNIGFKDRFIKVRRKDEVVYVVLERLDGADGNISCKCVTTIAASLGSKKNAVEGSDFVAFDDKVVFNN